MTHTLGGSNENMHVGQIPTAVWQDAAFIDFLQVVVTNVQQQRAPDLIAVCLGKMERGEIHIYKQSDTSPHTPTCCVFYGSSWRHYRDGQGQQGPGVRGYAPSIPPPSQSKGAPNLARQQQQQELLQQQQKLQQQQRCRLAWFL
jgi:hypothetical protein